YRPGVEDKEANKRTETRSTRMDRVRLKKYRACAKWH
ncbi:unnamed protein product, partial [marine sediment metagenome]